MAEYEAEVEAEIAESLTGADEDLRAGRTISWSVLRETLSDSDE